MNQSPEAPIITTVELADLITGVLASPLNVDGLPNLRSYPFFKENCDRFAEECRLAGGASKAAETIERFYELELTEWDGTVKIV